MVEEQVAFKVDIGCILGDYGLVFMVLWGHRRQPDALLAALIIVHDSNGAPWTATELVEDLMIVSVDAGSTGRWHTRVMVAVPLKPVKDYAIISSLIRCSTLLLALDLRLGRRAFVPLKS